MIKFQTRLSNLKTNSKPTVKKTSSAQEGLRARLAHPGVRETAHVYVPPDGHHGAVVVRVLPVGEQLRDGLLLPARYFKHRIMLSPFWATSSMPTFLSTRALLINVVVSFMHQTFVFVRPDPGQHPRAYELGHQKKTGEGYYKVVSREPAQIRAWKIAPGTTVHMQVQTFLRIRLDLAEIYIQQNSKVPFFTDILA